MGRSRSPRRGGGGGRHGRRGDSRRGRGGGGHNNYNRRDDRGDRPRGDDRSRRGGGGDRDREWDNRPAARGEDRDRRAGENPTAGGASSSRAGEEHGGSKNNAGANPQPSPRLRGAVAASSSSSAVLMSEQGPQGEKNGAGGAAPSSGRGPSGKMEIKINYAAFHGDKTAGRRDSDPKQPGAGGDSNRNGRNRNRHGSDRNPGNSLFSQRTGAASGLFSDVAAQATRGRRGDGEGRRGDGDRSGTNAEHRNNKRERDGRDGDREHRNNSSPLTKKQRKRERERDRKKMFDRDFDPKTQPRVCVVFRGLPGSGKTLMCNLMHNVFGGTVLTYEEIVHKYMGRIKTGVVDSLDTAWMTELDQAIENDSKRFLFVDRVHGKKEERDVVEDLLESKFVEEKKGMVLFVDLVHTADSTQQLDSGDIVYRGYSPAHIDLCAKRIQKRGSAHYTNLPGTGIKAETKSLEIVNTAAYSAEFLTMAERSRWGRYFFLSVELSPLSAVMEVVACLRSYLPDGASLIAPPERSDATAAVVAATGSVLSGGGASSSTTAAGASSSSSTGEIKPKPKETAVEEDQDVSSADKQGDSETKDESKAADAAAAAAGKVELVTKEDDKKTPEGGEKAEEVDDEHKANGKAPDRAAAEAKSSTEDDEDQDSKGREDEENEKPEGGAAEDTSSKADAGAGADKPAEAKKEESAEQQKAPVAAVQPKLTAEKVREKLRQGLEALQQKERAWRGVTEAEICAHCKVEEEQLEGNEHLVNITEVLRREEEEAALAKGRRYRREESKIRETRLCKGCWTKWNNERKEKEREEKERQEQEQKSEKRLYWEIRADDGIKDMMAKKLPAHIKMIDEPHVTLVYFGKGETEEEEASNAGVSVHVLEGLHESLLAMDGDKVELLMEKIIVAKNLVCAVVSIGDGMLLPTAKPDAEPFHITLGVADGTKPVEAGEIVRAVSTKPQSELESMEIACVTLKKPKKYAGRIQLKVG